MDHINCEEVEIMQIHLPQHGYHSGWASIASKKHGNQQETILDVMFLACVRPIITFKDVQQINGMSAMTHSLGVMMGD